MTEYIEKGLVLSALNVVVTHANATAGNSEIMKRVCGILEDCKNIVAVAPSADVVPVVHGRWVAKPTMYRHPNARNYYCSECRYEPTETKKFCPLCGARMDGE